jgi:hypothetical protein
VPGNIAAMPFGNYNSVLSTILSSYPSASQGVICDLLVEAYAINSPLNCENFIVRGLKHLLTSILSVFTSNFLLITQFFTSEAWITVA